MSSRENRAEGDVDKIVRRRFFPGVGAGRVFVDVGAAGPDYLSISALYRSIGWRVIAVEPNPVYCEAHRAKGHEIYEYACGARDEDDIDFVVVDSHGAEYKKGQVSYESFSSIAIKDSYAALKGGLDKKTIKVDLRRLDTILKTHAPDIDRIDILSVDVEGWELEVLDGLSMSRYRPRVMIIENLFADEKYRSYMRNIDYALWKSIPPNEVYVSGEFGSSASPWWRRYLRDLSDFLRK
jgi:FkbM family methyltransferase